MEQRIAIFDLGSNAFKLLIAEKSENPEGFKIIHKEQSGVKLASKGINKKIITDDARERALEAIASFKVTAEKYLCRNIKCTGTSAFRDAKNGQILVNEIKERFHLDVEIISGEREAELIHKGVSIGFDMDKKPILIMDIGGGSLEIIIANQSKIFYQKSFDLGMRRVMEKLDLPDPLTNKDIEKIINFFDIEFEELNKTVEEYNPYMLIGTSGSFETLSKLVEVRKQRPLRKISTASYKLSRTRVQELHDYMVKMPEKKRKEIEGMDMIRVDLIAIAMVFVNHIIKKYNFEKVTYCEFALKEGLLTEALNQLD
jgi:exopolyphosphatase/guanosine-5'-triphosphate,3'-diphosphate pyrophosphatase